MIGVGAMIGAGIFVLTGIAAGNSGPAALIAFGLNGVITLFTALSYAELSSAIPEAGGGYSFIKKVLPNITEYAEAEPFLRESQTLINKAQRIAFDLKVPHTYLMKIGRSVAAEIVQVAKENGCQLILLGYKKDEDPLENSVIHRVINRQPCDVAILKCDSEEVPSFRRILISIGGQEVHDHLKARIVHSLSSKEENEVTFYGVIAEGSATSVIKKTEESLRNTAAKYNMPRARIEVGQHYEVAQAIAAIANQHDFLILGMRKGAWLKSFLFGMTAQQITGLVRCPTLLTKTKSPTGTGLKKTSEISGD